MAKFPKYIELLKIKPEAKSEAMASARAVEMRARATLEMATLDSNIAALEQRANELVAVYPLDFAKILQVQDEAALLARRREQFRALIGDLFPDE